MTNQQNYADQELVSLGDLLRPLQRRWKLLLTIPLSVALLTLLGFLLLPRRYEARVVLATIGPNKAISGLGSLQALTGALPGQGLTASPEFVQALLESQQLLRTVGASVPPGRRRPLVEEMTGDFVPATKIADRMNRFIQTRISRQTGLITVLVRHQDSSLTRFTASTLESTLQTTFSSASHAQANMQRQAQDRRVDSAFARLRVAEQRLRSFVSQNRSLTPFAIQTLEKEEYQREVELAKQFYLQAVSDRDGAEARQLEDTPVVVTIDPVPDQMPFEPRFLGLKVSIALIAAALLVVTGIYFAHGLRMDPQ